MVLVLAGPWPCTICLTLSKVISVSSKAGSISTLPHSHKDCSGNWRELESLHLFPGIVGTKITQHTLQARNGKQRAGKTPLQGRGLAKTRGSGLGTLTYHVPLGKSSNLALSCAHHGHCKKTEMWGRIVTDPPGQCQSSYRNNFDTLQSGWHRLGTKHFCMFNEL